MENKEYYQSIFKRKSFHLFRDTKKLSEEDLNDLSKFLETVVPLHPHKDEDREGIRDHLQKRR